MNQMITKRIAEELKIRLNQAEAAVKLIDEGNTIPFIARYRKEATGGLNDEELRKLDERLKYLRTLAEKKQQVVESIEAQGLMTEELRAAIEKAMTQVEVEDIYRPFRPKRRTRAGIAREKGLAPLAELILQQDKNTIVEKEAERFLDPEKEVLNTEDAIQGALDIIAETIADNAEYRAYLRDLTFRQGHITSEGKDKETSTVYDMYYEFSEEISEIPGYRILAINRGEKEKQLTVKIEAPDTVNVNYLKRKVITGSGDTAKYLQAAIEDSYQRLIAPSVEREMRNAMTQRAEDGAILIFGKNLEQLLMQPPIAGHVVLGWDPAFRTGCKLAIVDKTGKVLATKVIFPTAPQNRVDESKKILKDLIARYHVTLISVGNGTASRESEQIIAELIRELPTKVEYVIVNEAGASVYSASKLATEEFPTFDVGQRSAASIARRLQDPLAELVKIDPKSIGVGQYQHDMDQKKLGESLHNVVTDCVNKVGVDLNTASAPLLEYVSGVTKTIAKNIVAYREENGSFRSRKQLMKVPKLGPKAYEQCAGFLRISNGENPLDATGVHPESYAAAEKLVRKMAYSMQDLQKGGLKGLREHVGSIDELAAELEVGKMTLQDIIRELEKPGRDPRDDMPKPLLRKDVMEMSDLKPGMILKGTVRNVIDFGAFVDIGVHQDGLVHISRMSNRFIKHPTEVVSVGDVIDVQILQVDEKKKRISLTMQISEKEQA